MTRPGGRWLESDSGKDAGEPGDASQTAEVTSKLKKDE